MNSRVILLLLAIVTLMSLPSVQATPDEAQNVVPSGAYPETVASDKPALQAAESAASSETTSPASTQDASKSAAETPELQLLNERDEVAAVTSERTPPIDIQAQGAVPIASGTPELQDQPRATSPSADTQSASGTPEPQDLRPATTPSADAQEADLSASNKPALQHPNERGYYY